MCYTSMPSIPGYWVQQKRTVAKPTTDFTKLCHPNCGAAAPESKAIGVQSQQVTGTKSQPSLATKSRQKIPIFRLLHLFISNCYKTTTWSQADEKWGMGYGKVLLRLQHLCKARLAVLFVVCQKPYNRLCYTSTLAYFMGTNNSYKAIYEIHWVTFIIFLSF